MPFAYLLPPPACVNPPSDCLADETAGFLTLMLYSLCVVTCMRVAARSMSEGRLLFLEGVSARVSSSKTTAVSWWLEKQESDSLMLFHGSLSQQ